MKVLLISPPFENEISGFSPRFIGKDVAIYPSMGILYIAAYLEKYYSHHQVGVIDAVVEKMDYQGLRERIIAEKPGVVGITAITTVFPDVIKAARLVKEINQDIYVVIGGPHVHCFQNETIAFSCVDCLILGEGEKVFGELLEVLDSSDRSQLKNIQGLVVKDGDEIVNTGVFPKIEDLDELPFPARHLISYKNCTSLLSKGVLIASIMTSRGCPYQCSFCCRPFMEQQFRQRSAKNVVDELELCIGMGITEFQFYDDTFTLNKKRVLEICDEVVKRKLKINFHIRTRIDRVDEEMIVCLKRAGCQFVSYGVEAGTEKILKVLNKGINLQQVRRVFKFTKKHKITILAFFMIGNPHETREDILETFKVVNELNPDFLAINIFSPLPHTTLYFEGIKSGVLSEDCWMNFAKNPENDFILPHWEEHFTRKELEELLVQGYKQFYLKPSYVLKKVISIRSVKELVGLVRLGINFIRLKVESYSD